MIKSIEELSLQFKNTSETIKALVMEGMHLISLYRPMQTGITLASLSTKNNHGTIRDEKLNNISQEIYVFFINLYRLIYIRASMYLHVSIYQSGKFVLC